MRTYFRRVCEQLSWNGAIDLTKERGVYNLYIQVAGGDGNIGQAIDVIPNEMEVDESGPSCIGWPSASESERVPAKPTQAEQDEHYATGHAAYRSWFEHCVKGRGRASPHAVVSEGELPEVGVDYAYLGPEVSEVTICVCKCKRTGCLASTLKGITQRMDSLKLECGRSRHRLTSHLEERLKRQLDWSEPHATWLVRHSANCLSRYKIQMMGKRLISDAQESVGGVKLLNLEKRQHFYRSPHVVKVEWQVMRKE